MTVTFYDNRGRKEAADMKEIVFSDGITRMICTHTHVPDSYLPDDVYGASYDVIGTYTTAETKSTEWFNARMNTWEGAPGCTLYHFTKL